MISQFVQLFSSCSCSPCFSPLPSPPPPSSSYLLLLVLFLLVLVLVLVIFFLLLFLLSYVLLIIIYCYVLFHIKNKCPIIYLVHNVVGSVKDSFPELASCTLGMLLAQFGCYSHKRQTRFQNTRKEGKMEH